MNWDIISGNVYLILYILSWVGVLYFYQQSRSIIDAGSVLLISYLLYSVISILLFNSPYFKFESLSLFPFIYLFAMLLLAFTPVLLFNPKKVEIIKAPPILFFHIISLIYIIASLSQLPSIISDFSVNILRLLFVSTGGQDLYNESMADSYSLGDGSISNLASIISNSYGNFGILLFFFYLTICKRNILITIGLFLSSLISILSNISMGQRGPILEVLFSMLITYYSLRHYYSKKINKAIKSIGVVIFSLAIIPLVILTNSRFSDSIAGSSSSVYFYAGQQNLFFNNYGLDNGGIRYGDRTIPLFKKMIGIKNVPDNFWERRNKYPNLKINDEAFISFVGDFTLDFGPYLSVIFFLTIFPFIAYLTKSYNKKLYFHQFILLHFVMSLCMLGGMKLYPFSDVGGNLQLIVYVLAYLFFLIVHELFNKRSSISTT